MEQSKLLASKYPNWSYLGRLSANSGEAEQSLLANLMLPEGKRFNPGYAVSRAELTDAIVRSGLVSQYVAGNPMFLDVGDRYTRNSVESVHSIL